MTSRTCRSRKWGGFYRAPAAWLGTAIALVAFNAADSPAAPPAGGAVGGPASTRPVGEDGVAAEKRRALAPLEAGYAKLVASHPDDEAIRTFQSRLAAIDEVADLLVRRLRSTDINSLEAILGGVASGARGGSGAAKLTMSAREILGDYAVSFATGLPRPAVSGDQLTLLLNYYNASIKASEEYVARRARVSAATDDGAAADVVQLCLVLPFLHVPDPQWAAAETAALPEWMRRPRVLAHAESFALSVERPLTAFQFARAARGADAPDVYKYLGDASETLYKGREYHAAIHCMKVAIASAAAETKVTDANVLRLRLAAMYSEVGHPQLAADEAKHVLDTGPAAGPAASAAMLRLKYLYEAEAYPQIVDEAPRYEATESFKPYLAQMEYIRWVALRRIDRAEDAKRVQQAFLTRFPEHVLGADMYFASAMVALAASDYAETVRLLDIIQYKYPTAQIMPKVKEVRQRLEKATSGDTVK